MATENGYSHGSHGRYSHRPLAWGTNGMVGAGTQLTAQAGLRVLWQGGNAVDAAVASALAGGVVEPTAHYTLGGEVAFLLYDAESGSVRSVVGQGWAPAAATVDLYLERWGEIPSGVLSTTVPGVISALLVMLERHGTLSFSDAVDTALTLARDGFPAYPTFSEAIDTPARTANLSKYPASASIFLPNGKAPEVGALFKQADLARTLAQMVAAEGRVLDGGGGREAGIHGARDEFYKGDLARRMAGALEDLGGLHTYDDFAEYESPFEEPLSVTYREYQIYTNRTWTQGIALLQALSILDGLDLRSMCHNSPEAVHALVEAVKLAMADRERYAGDPAHVEVPFDGLLSPEYGAARRSLLDLNQAQAKYAPGDPLGRRAIDAGSSLATGSIAQPAGDNGDTTYLSTADAHGNMVSATPSTFGGMSQGMVLGDTGIMINCRGSYFWLDQDNPNAIGPRKRPRTTPCTFIVLKNGRPFMTLGTPGGDSQVQSCLQVFTNIADFGMEPQEAVSAPRFRSSSFPASPWPHGSTPNRLAVESRMPQATMDGLRDRGHQIEVVGPWGVSNGFTPIMVDQATGVYRGGADPRSDAVMLGW